MARLPLSCPVRGCGLALTRRDRQAACRAGHSFDIARSGYLNLLQPGDRRSPRAGDSAAAIDARARLARNGVGRALLERVADLASGLGLPGEAVSVDLGSGCGDGLAAVTRTATSAGIGIDLSIAAVTHAARAYPHLTWVVANADRRLPLLDGAITLVLSLHARRNPTECARVLQPGGHLIVAVPAPDDLVELREAVSGRAANRERAEAVIAEHGPAFALTARHVVRQQLRLDAAALSDVLRSSYRGARLSQASRVDSLASLDVTFASDLMLFVRR